MSAQAEVTVIIPTIADERRAKTIWRAIESAGPASGAITRVIVVVNGKRFSPRLLEELSGTAGVECVYVEQGSLPLALLTGRQAVRSEFFAFIDDDDEFLHGGLGKRLAIARAHPDAAFVISQGWFRASSDVLQVAIPAHAIMADPLGTLLYENWLCTSASGLYRSTIVTADDFAEMPSYLEWTYLGFRLAARHEFMFFDEPTYRRYDTTDSVSKSLSFRLGMVYALQSILRLDLPGAVRAGLRRKITKATHDLSEQALESGHLSQAWLHHMRSIPMPGGWKYLPYTRHLLRPSARWR
jgi:hypothetical protein